MKSYVTNQIYCSKIYVKNDSYFQMNFYVCSVLAVMIVLDIHALLKYSILLLT